jgi:hypothetical protein
VPEVLDEVRMLKHHLCATHMCLVTPEGKREKGMKSHIQIHTERERERERERREEGSGNETDITQLTGISLRETTI